MEKPATRAGSLGSVDGKVEERAVVPIILGTHLKEHCLTGIFKVHVDQLVVLYQPHIPIPLAVPAAPEDHPCVKEVHAQQSVATEVHFHVETTLMWMQGTVFL
jgi:hypothetical protein